MGTHNESSDIDLVAFGKDLNRHIITDLLLELDESPIIYKVDLRIFNTLRYNKLLDNIKRVGQVFYENDI